MPQSPLYQSISIYQTRILCLHGDDGIAGSALRCDLYPADIVHPSFAGIGVRSGRNGEDYVVPYEALSYAWGSTVYSKSIICNDVHVGITENLYHALKVLRPISNGRRYIWIDALCINQWDPVERSQQVQNMLVIYQNARKVIAWLGPAHQHTLDVLTAAAASASKKWLEKSEDISNVLKGLDDLYSRPWFKRMWVQQEIRAARELVLYCGNLQFSWFSALSNPESLFPPLEIQSHEPAAWYKLKAQPVPTNDPYWYSRKSVSTLRANNMAHLRCFERFSQEAKPVDFVETLLITGLLQATDPKDYIYGILGLTNLPAKPMPLQTWAATRSSELCIPIDYSADLNDILTTVTWLAIMKGGLSVIAKFKSFPSRGRDISTSHLPSWVIDWRVAAGLFRRKLLVRDSSFAEKLKDPDRFPVTIENPWDIRSKAVRGGVTRPRSGQPPHQHAQVVADNSTTTHSFRKLVVRGYKATLYYATNNHVYLKEADLEDRVCWQIPQGTGRSDIVVFLFGFVASGVDSSTSGQQSRCDGLWLLRPVNNLEHKLVAYLPWNKGEHLDLYDYWEWDQPSAYAKAAGQKPDHDRLAATPRIEGMRYRSALNEGDVVDVYKFVIV
ncbi:heterokaryon incompatibility protein-domain-containing protein [Phaeosphaeria sp. MPI-PUGE-AT-0046c]|nr:heterokaryon incompatibility protein-domain-containing protein [Phaeosphaeria sp. MPI-PUGE-AT-0046c]